ncbi:protoporphyrinogen oxidase HemJ [Geitlerinema splendidum]|nr:protoporphyrinogen oxidase HemJ [Geitlerinema splendidum]
MLYLWFKAFHIIGIVVWFSGLFYLVRLFVYYAEANLQPEPARGILQPQYRLMAQRLYNLITTPGMILTLAMAIALLQVDPTLIQSPWLQCKLVFVTGVVAYHFYCGYLLKQIEKGQSDWNGQQFRILNEVPTVLLIAIALLAVFKQTLPLNTLLGTLGIAISAIAIIFWLYAKQRQRLSQQTP